MGQFITALSITRGDRFERGGFSIADYRVIPVFITFLLFFKLLIRKVGWGRTHPHGSRKRVVLKNFAENKKGATNGI